MKQLIAELNAAPTYEAQFSHLYKVLPDLTLDNLLDLHQLIPHEVHATTADRESMTAITKSQIHYLFNER